jgi:ATP-dependent Zn protease
VCAGSAILSTSLLKNPNFLNLSKPQQGQTKQVLFSDIYGNEDIKEKLSEFIDYLKNPIKYR